MRTDLASLSSQLNQLKDVIDQQENEAQDKENRLVTEHKRDGLSLRLEIFLDIFPQFDETFLKDKIFAKA